MNEHLLYPGMGERGQHGRLVRAWGDRLGSASWPDPEEVTLRFCFPAEMRALPKSWTQLHPTL